MARPLTVTVFGNAQLDTSKSALGSQSSLYLPGTGDYITMPNDIIDSNANRYFDLGEGSGYPASYSGGGGWRIDFWYYTVGGSSNGVLIGSTRNNEGAGWSLNQDLVFNGNTPNFNRVSDAIDAGQTLYNGWRKITILSNGDYGNVWLNGYKIFNSAIDNMGILEGGSVVVVGAKKLPNGTVSNTWESGVWIDELRITVGRGDGDSSDDTLPVESVQYGTDTVPLFLGHFNGTDGSTAIVDSFPTTHLASANLEALFSQVSVQNPSPSMVYLQNDVFTWADADTWDNIYENNDRWSQWGNYASQQFLSSASVTVKGGLTNVSGTADLTSTATLQVDARLSDVRGTADLTSTATLSGTARLLKFANLDITSLGDLTVFGIVDIKAKADLASTVDLYAKGGLLIGIDDPYDYTWDTVPEDQWNGFLIDQWRPSGWFAFDAVTLTSSGDVTKTGQADLTSTAAVAVDARLSDVRGSADLNSTFTQGNVDARTFLRASADLNSEFTLTSGSDNSKDGSATLEAFAAEVTVGRLSDVRGSADLVSQFTLASGSDLYRNASSTLEAEATLTSTSAVTLVNAANLDSQFALESQSRILKLANLDITSLGDLSVVGSLTLNAVSSLEGAFTQTARAGYSLSGSANLAAEFTEIVRPTLIPSVELDEVAFNADLTARGQMTYGAAAQLEAFAAEVAVGQRIQGAKASLEAEFTTIVTGSATLGGQARLDAFVAQLTDGRISDIRGSATLAGTFAAEFAGELKLLDSQFIYMVLNEDRKFGIESEIRKYDVLSENRLFDIDPESRGYQVLPENRTVDVGYFMQ